MICDRYIEYFMVSIDKFSITVTFIDVTDVSILRYLKSIPKKLIRNTNLIVRQNLSLV